MVEGIEETSPALVVDNVRKNFGPIQALKGLSFSINPGEVVGLLGDNGAGKSTFVKILSGVLPPSSGEITLNSRDLRLHSPKDARKHGIETVYQTLALCDNFSVAENLFLGREETFGGPLKFLKSRSMRRNAVNAIQELGVNIPGLAKSVIGDMSGGQRQAVAIARAAFWQSELLLLDEPTAALGVKETAEVQALIKRMVSDGLPVLLVSHNMEEVWELCNKMIIVRQGVQVATLERNNTTTDEVVSYITGAKGPAPTRN